MRDRRITSIGFQTNLLDLLNMTTNPMDWPAFASKIELLHRLHEDFENVNLAHIPPSRNGWTDSKQEPEVVFSPI